MKQWIKKILKDASDREEGLLKKVKEGKWTLLLLNRLIITLLLSWRFLFLLGGNFDRRNVGSLWTFEGKQLSFIYYRKKK